MFTQAIQTGKLALLATVVAAGMGATAAEAGHRSYAFRGRHVGCGGETHMIHALQYIDRAFARLHFDPHHRDASLAQQEAHVAMGQARSYSARYKLQRACQELSYFRATHSVDRLARAGELIERALQQEQRYHVSLHHTHVHSIPVGGVHIGHGHGHGRGHIGFSINGRRGGVSIRFGR